MKSATSIQKLFAVGISTCFLSALSIQAAEAQRPVSLIEQQCVRSGNSGWYTPVEDIVVGRELYTSIMFMNPYNFKKPNGMTCKLTPGRFSTLHLQFGMRDTTRDGIGTRIVSVWLDGNQAASRSVSRGQVKTIFLDIKNARSLTLEVGCIKAEGCRTVGHVDFFKADLESSPTSPGSR